MDSEIKVITMSEFLKGNLEPNITYTIQKNPSIRKRVEKWMEDKGLDSYSRFIKNQYKKGITNDLSYDNTIDKCGDKQFIRLLSVEGFSYFMELKNEDIDKNVEYKVKKLINDNKVGYVDDDSIGCYLCCRTEDYKYICSYLKVDYDTRDDDKEFYYHSLFDDIRMWFNDYCTVNTGVSDKTIYSVVRYTIVHIYRYVDILMKARDWNGEHEDKFWVNVLWNEAYTDMKKDKKGYIAWS